MSEEFQRLDKENADKPCDLLRDNRIVPKFPEGGSITGFVSLFEYSHRLLKRKGMDYVRWLFTMLMWRRIVEMLNPGKSAQVLEIMKKRLFARIGGVAPTEIGVSKDDIYNNIALWSVLGDKIKTFCTALGGNGCLFFLSSQLSVALYVHLTLPYAVH